MEPIPTPAPARGWTMIWLLAALLVPAARSATGAEEVCGVVNTLHPRPVISDPPVILGRFQYFACEPEQGEWVTDEQLVRVLIRVVRDIESGEVMVAPSTVELTDLAATLSPDMWRDSPLEVCRLFEHVDTWFDAGRETCIEGSARLDERGTLRFETRGHAWTYVKWPNRGPFPGPQAPNAIRTTSWEMERVGAHAILRAVDVQIEDRYRSSSGIYWEYTYTLPFPHPKARWSEAQFIRL